MDWAGMIKALLEFFSQGLSTFLGYKVGKTEASNKDKEVVDEAAKDARDIADKSSKLSREQLIERLREQDKQ